MGLQDDASVDSASSLLNDSWKFLDSGPLPNTWPELIGTQLPNFTHDDAKAKRKMSLPYPKHTLDDDCRWVSKLDYWYFEN